MFRNKIVGLTLCLGLTLSVLFSPIYAVPQTPTNTTVRQVFDVRDAFTYFGTVAIERNSIELTVSVTRPGLSQHVYRYNWETEALSAEANGEIVFAYARKKSSPYQGTVFGNPETARREFLQDMRVLRAVREKNPSTLVPELAFTIATGTDTFVNLPFNDPIISDIVLVPVDGSLFLGDASTECIKACERTRDMCMKDKSITDKTICIAGAYVCIAHCVRSPNTDQPIPG